MFTLSALMTILAAGFLGHIVLGDFARDLNARRRNPIHLLTDLFYLVAVGCAIVTALYAMWALWVRA